MREDAAKLHRETVKKFTFAILHGGASRTSAAINRRVARLVRATGLTTMQVWEKLQHDARVLQKQRDSATVNISELKPR